MSVDVRGLLPATLIEQWQDIHRESLAPIRTVAARPASISSSSATLAAARLPPGTVKQEATLAPCAELVELSAIHSHLNELETILNDMYIYVRAAQADVATLHPDFAADRGDSGLAMSPADRCTALAAALNAYEAELAMKRRVLTALSADTPLPSGQIHSLLAVWEHQPFLSLSHSISEGATAQAVVDAALSATNHRLAPSG